MRLLEKLSENLSDICHLSQLPSFARHDLVKVLKRSLKVLDPKAAIDVRNYVLNAQSESGAFTDKAGNDDLYYTLFGSFIGDALDLTEVTASAWNYTRKIIAQDPPAGINLYCAAILSARSGNKRFFLKRLGQRFKESVQSISDKQNVYNSFMGLLSCYYLNDLNNIRIIGNKLGSTDICSIPAPVLSAYLVLQHSFGKKSDYLQKQLLSFYDGLGGFKASRNAKVPDLLSTAVSLYALNYSGSDLTEIRPDCLDFIDNLFMEGGFAGTFFDTEPDIEYTFYGLLALGALAE